MAKIFQGMSDTIIDIAPSKILIVNPNSLDNKGSCWILLDFYCSVTMLYKELGVMFLTNTNSGQEI